jgi:hypothetical protein
MHLGTHQIVLRTLPRLCGDVDTSIYRLQPSRSFSQPTLADPELNRRENTCQDGCALNTKARRIKYLRQMKKSFWPMASSALFRLAENLGQSDQLSWLAHVQSRSRTGLASRSGTDPVRYADLGNSATGTNTVSLDRGDAEHTNLPGPPFFNRRLIDLLRHLAT